MEKKKVLFVCIHNSARSQMAQAYLNDLAGDRFHAASAGLEKGKLNPLAVTVMSEEGIDISGYMTKTVFDLLEQGLRFDYVITVCDAGNSERCPVFPGANQSLHWSFEDPSAIGGTEEEKLEKTRHVRDQIRQAVVELIRQMPIK
jgi:arsenate reductase (thioredoxin)